MEAGRDDRHALYGAITAAGESSRMGVPKALLQWGEESFLRTMLRAAHAAGVRRPCLVIVGAESEEIALEARAGSGLPIENRESRHGRFSSVQAAARWVIEDSEDELERTGLMIWPVDCPAVQASTLALLADAAQSNPDANIVPRHNGRGGHPVVLCGEFLEEVVAAPIGSHLREMMRSARAGTRHLDVGDSAVLDNLNTPSDYEAFLRSRPAASKAG